MEQRKTVTFRVCGDGMTETAREFLYRNHKYETALELLKGCLLSDDLSEEQQLSLCLDILEGRARLTGIYPDGDYHLEEDHKDLPGIGGLIRSLSEQLKAEQERRQKLELHRNFLISCMTEEMPTTCRDYLKRYMEEFEEPMLTREEETSLGIVWPVRTGLHGMVDSFLDRMSCDLDEEDYGWLTPDGTFHAVEWGDHQQWADDYLKESLDEDDYWEVEHAGDYLTEHHWILLHNPAQGLARPTMDPSHNPTKAQREFLYDYYTKRNHPELAREYLEE